MSGFEIERVGVEITGEIEPDAVRFARWRLGRFITDPLLEVPAGEPEIVDPWSYFLSRGYLEAGQPEEGETVAYVASWDAIRKFFREQGGMDYQEGLAAARELYRHSWYLHESERWGKIVNPPRDLPNTPCECPLSYRFLAADPTVSDFDPLSLVETLRLYRDGDADFSLWGVRQKGKKLLSIYGSALESQLPPQVTS